jgi:hypothetical protein
MPSSIRTRPNVERIRSLAERRGATRPDGSAIPEDGISADHSIHLRMEQGELDPVSEKTAGIRFENLIARAEIRRVDGVEAPICSLADLVAMKRAVGRERDLVDLADLEAAHGELPDGSD